MSDIIMTRREKLEAELEIYKKAWDQACQEYMDAFTSLQAAQRRLEHADTVCFTPANCVTPDRFGYCRTCGDHRDAHDY